MSPSPTNASLSIACPIPRHRLAYRGVTRHLTYTFAMADEDTVLEEAMDNLKEAGQRIKATQGLMRSEGLTAGENHRDLLARLSTALAMTEAAYLEARRRRDL